MPKTIRNDIILIGTIILLALLSAILIRGVHSEAGTAVSVAVDGQVISVYPLFSDREVSIAAYGGRHCTMRISGGQVSMIYAECPDKICVHHAPILHVGESIICLPGRVVLTIVGDDPDALDATSR